MFFDPIHLWEKPNNAMKTQKKSRQHRAESKRTPSIKEIRGLRFRAYPPDTDDGIIEIVNAADGGRVCVLYLEDFNSVEDAVVYSNLLALAPLLLDSYMNDHSKLAVTVKRVERIIERAKKSKRLQKKRPFGEWPKSRIRIK